jgi:hypothetical protein
LRDISPEAFAFMLLVTAALIGLAIWHRLTD